MERSAKIWAFIKVKFICLLIAQYYTTSPAGDVAEKKNCITLLSSFTFYIYYILPNPNNCNNAEIQDPSLMDDHPHALYAVWHIQGLLGRFNR